MTTEVVAVLVAAGRGERLGDEVPKQFLDLGGKPVMAHALSDLASFDRVDGIVVVLPEEYPEFVDDWLSHPKVISTTTGGATRQQSVSEGLVCLPEQVERVLVHDGARPLAGAALTTRVLDALDGSCDGVVPALPVEEAIKEVSGGSVVLGSRSREGLWRAQTPQAFHRTALEEALARMLASQANCEDCSEMLVRAGFRVRAVEGDPLNLKITTRRDLALCEQIIQWRATKGGPE